MSQNYGDGSINYVEYSYALKSGFPVAKVLNAAGYYIEPTASSVAVALLKAQIDTNKGTANYLTQILDGVYNNPDPRTYPLSSYSYMIVPTQVAGIFTEAKGKTLSAFANYFLCEGQQQAGTLGYSPLPMNLVLAGFDQIKLIPGAQASNVDINSCHNPTFKPGDSPNSNQLAVTAPQPAACDKQGTSQCNTGTAGAANTPTVTSGSGTGGASAGASGGGSGAAAAAGGAAAGAADTAAGATADGSASGLDGASATAIGGTGARATPYALADDSWSSRQVVMLLAAVLLLAAIVLPPVLFRRLRLPGRASKD